MLRGLWRQPESQAALARGLAVLAAVAMSITLAIWLSTLGHDQLGYLTRNELEPERRSHLLLWLGGAAGVAALLAFVTVLVTRVSAVRLEQIALRISPLLVVVWVPLCLPWRVWKDEQQTFLVLAGLGTLLLAASLRSSSGQPPLWSGWSTWISPAKWAQTVQERWPRVWRHTPLVLAVLAAAGYSVYFSVVTVTYHRNGNTSTYDLGILQNVVYNSTYFSFSDPLFKVSPIRGPEGGHFSLHATFIAFAIAPIYRLAPRAETLLILQSVLCGAGAIPLFLIARRRLSPWIACALAYSYVLYPPLHGANLYDFHFLTLAPFFILLTAYGLESRRPILTAVSLVLALSVREDIGLGLGLLGAFYVLSGERTRAGATIAIVGIGCSLLMKLVIMPPEGHGASFLYMYGKIVPKGAKGAEGILKTVVGNPVYTLTTLLTREKLTYALMILLPVWFMPARRPLALLLLVPGFAFTLLTTPHKLANSTAPIQISFQYTAHWTAYVFLATVFGLAYLAQRRAEDDAATRHSSPIWPLLAATLACSYQFGAVLQRHTARGAFDQYRFGTTEEDLELRQARDELLAQIPPDARVAAAERILPHVSNRANAYTLRQGIWDAEYIIFSFGGRHTRPDDLSRVRGALAGREFGVVEVNPPFALLKRGFDPSRNAELLADIARAKHH